MDQIINRPSSPSILLRQIAAVSSLYQAWRKVRANRGAAGVDAVSLLAFEQNLQPNLAELSRNLLNRTYEPLPARYVNVPKSDGRQRELAIPTVRDRVTQRAVLDCIEPLFEPQLLDCSYAFRPGRSVEMAIQQIIVARANGLCWIVDADIKDFFPRHSSALIPTGEKVRATKPGHTCCAAIFFAASAVCGWLAVITMDEVFIAAHLFTTPVKPAALRAFPPKNANYGPGKRSQTTCATLSVSLLN